MKFLKFFERKDNRPEVCSISDRDLDLLAIMCRRCDPKIFKKDFVMRCYAYYVPQDEMYLEIAKKIFVRNGIPVHEHVSYILGFCKQKVLRVDYTSVKNKDKLKKEMKRIEANLASMYASGKWFENEELQKQIQELKEAQR